ncbi:hypothetical protein [Sporosarcina sp. FSL K6-5500]|uniref:hypothetical protein n=1 Tax=Sporosarcina sp. FSL K6-5500 TaxID=2921558 RepID=UPI0030F83B4E
MRGGLGKSNQDNLIGTEIKAGAFQTLESKRTETIERGAYGSYNLLKFHIYENGLIVKEYQLGTRKPIQYEVVKEVEEEFDDGGFRELDNYFEGTKLAFVDYIQPNAIFRKGFGKWCSLSSLELSHPNIKGIFPLRRLLQLKISLRVLVRLRRHIAVRLVIEKGLGMKLGTKLKVK